MSLSLKSSFTVDVLVIIFLQLYDETLSGFNTGLSGVELSSAMLSAFGDPCGIKKDVG